MKYMVEIKLNPKSVQQHAEMSALVPMEQAHVQNLSEQGIVKTLYIAADGMRAWGIMEGDTVEQVERQLSACSLSSYMQTEFAGLI